MKKENSYGIIPLRFRHQWEVLLIQHHSGHWSFPKGHAEAGEHPLQTAERELNEETGLSVARLLSTDPMLEQYCFTLKGAKISKTVQFYPAIVEGEVAIQRNEIRASQWLSLRDAQKRITFKEGQRLCGQLEEMLNRENPINSTE